MNENARTKLLELLKNLGYPENAAVFDPKPLSDGLYDSTVEVKLSDGRIFKANGKGKGKTNANNEAARALLEQLRRNHPEIFINWEEINVEAQRGDALIKLAVYLSTKWQSADDKSKQLQNLESDFYLAQLFDDWKSQGNPDLAIWGDNLGGKRKATLVEALLWRRFGMQLITTDAPAQMQSLLQTLRS